MFSLFLPLVASAHVGDVVAGIDLHVGAQPSQEIYIEASYGLLLGQGEDFAWVCHEAITAPGALKSPRYHRTSQQTWLAWLPDPEQGRDGQTLFRSSDACGWEPPVGIEGKVVQAVASSGLEVAVAAGADGLLRSADDGSSFSPWLSAPDRRFGSVMVGTGAVLWWATATDAARERLFVWTFVDGAWSEHELPLPAGSAVPVDLPLLATREDRAWLAVDPLGVDALLEVSFGPTGLESRPLDTGSPGAITDLAVDGDTLWFVRDGLFLFSLDLTAPGSVVEHPGFPPSLCVEVQDGQLWTAPQSQLAGALLSRSSDGGTSFETVAYPDDILTPLACPADSDVARACEPLWEQLLTRIRGFDSPVVDTGTVPDLPTIPPHPEDPVSPSLSETPPPEARCGCVTPSLPSGLGALWGLLWVVRTRRSR